MNIPGAILGLAAVMPAESMGEDARALPEVLQSPWASAALWSGMLAFVVVVTLGAYLLYARLRNQRESQEAADALFESQMIAMAHASRQPALDPRTEMTSLPTPPAEAFPVAESPEEAPDVSCSNVIQRLMAANMLERVGEYVEVHGNRKGAVILELKGGRRALLLPQYESEGFVRYNLRRYDCLVFVGRDGRAVFVNTLEETIAQRFSP